MSQQFGQTAEKLSQGPLGIIALFLVLIHGFASLVLGLAAGIGDLNRSVLVWFVVLFPLVVLGVFTWLVGTRHEKLYPPNAFHDEGHFVDLAFGRANFDKQGQNPMPSAGSDDAAAAVKPEATGNLYWLGHDLMWTADTLLRQGPRDNVLIGLDQSLHHLRDAGLKGTQIEQHLSRMRKVIREAATLPSASRDNLASELGAIIDQIGAAVETTQKGFRPPPHWHRVRG